jgi:hypothetical protein
MAGPHLALLRVHKVTLPGRRGPVQATLDNVEVDPKDILVVIAHPFGDIEVTLAEWIERGPGPRHLIRPVQARSRSTGEPLPLSVIPLRYRNDEESRRAIRLGLIDDPWPDQTGSSD